MGEEPVGIAWRFWVRLARRGACNDHHNVNVDVQPQIMDVW